MTVGGIKNSRKQSDHHNSQPRSRNYDNARTPPKKPSKCLNFSEGKHRNICVIYPERFCKDFFLLFYFFLHVEKPPTSGYFEWQWTDSQRSGGRPCGKVSEALSSLHSQYICLSVK